MEGILNGNSATISECGKYRYRLTRAGDLLSSRKPKLVVCMLNPSTADASLDDPTIRRLRGFAKALDRDGIHVVNAFAFRATNPKELLRVADPVGPGNDSYIAAAAAGADGFVVCAWGANCPTKRAAQVVEIIRKAGARTACWGTNANGSPKHPLYLPKTATLRRWSPTC